MNLKERIQTMLDELGIPVTRFCRNINLSTHAYYDWMLDRIDISDKRAESINEYLKKYGF